MLLALLLAQIGVQTANPAGPIITNPASLGAFATVEFAPASGRGMVGPCSATAPKGAKGETLNFSGASVRYCSKTASSGFAGTGIVDGDWVAMASGQPRVEYQVPGILGLRTEQGASEILLQTARICNAAYADVGTPACTANQGTGPLGTATAALLTDNDAVTQEGRSQFVASASQTRHTVWCSVKAGSATSATITLVGTGDGSVNCTGTVTGLSSTTSSTVECTSAGTPSTLTGVTMSILVGTVVADQGTILVDACNIVPLSAHGRTSYMDATAAGTNRADESAYIDTGSLQQFNSLAVSYTVSNTQMYVAGLLGVASANDTLLSGSPPLGLITNSGLIKGFANPIAYTPGGTNAQSDRVSVSIPTGGVTNRWLPTNTSTTAGSPSGTSRYLIIGSWVTTPANAMPAIITSRIKLDLTETGAR